jgi:hypothetical protein
MSWLKIASRRMKESAEDWIGLPVETRQRFDQLLAGDGSNAAVARVIFASQVHFLFRADRAWTEATVVPLFDWEADVSRASQAWHGFLTWGRWNDPLFERMRPFTLQTFTRLGALGDHKRSFLAALASVAAYSEADPWSASGWLLEFVGAASDEDLASWADAFGRSLDALPPEGVEALWNRWLLQYWQDRVTGVGSPLGEAEREAMAAWLCPLKGLIPLAIAQVLAAPPAVLDHMTVYRFRECGLATSHGLDVGRLLKQLLPSLSDVRYDTGELYEFASEALKNGADPSDIQQIADEMLRLGCAHADRLREEAGPG